MKYVQSYLLNMASAAGAGETGKASQTGRPKKDQGKDDFRKLLEDSQKPGKPEKAETEPVEQQEPAIREQASADTDEAELERQMSLAAMAVLCPTVQTSQEAAQLPQELQPQLVQALQNGSQPQQKGDPAPQLLTEQTAVAQEQTGGDAELLQTAEEAKAVPTGKPMLIEKPAAQAEAEPQTQAQSQESELPELKLLDGSQAAEQPLFRELKAVPIQVGEVSGAEKTAPTVSDQLGSRLSQAIRAGESRVELELEPRSLGKVRIELTLQRDGSLHVLLRAEKPSTQAILDRGAGELQSLLGRDVRQEVLVETPQHQEDRSAMYYDQEPEHRDQSRQGSQERDQHRDRDRNDSFLQQLRLGLTPVASM